MNWDAVSFDWNHVRAFLATVEHGSLSAAARALNQTQPTLSRQIANLEASLDITLFERGSGSLVLTDAGTALLEHVRSMAESAVRISRVATGQNQNISGTVRITASDAMATYILPGILVGLRQEHPGIDIELLPSNTISDLINRDADIAIRHERPEQADLIAKRVTELEVSLYATPGYLETLPRPLTRDTLAQATFIGYGSRTHLVPQLNALGIAVGEANFRITTNSGSALYELARAGAGIALLARSTHDNHATLQRVLSDLQPIRIPTWLVTHREVNTNRCIRLAFDHLSRALNEQTLQPV